MNDPGLEEHLVTLIGQRNELFEERLSVQQQGEAVMRLGGPPLTAEEEVYFRKYMRQMRDLGAGILELDAQIEETRAETARINGVRD